MNYDETNGPESTVSPVDARPIPRISIQSFCETDSVAESLAHFASDRRLSRAHVTSHRGGIRAAVDFYENAPTPNVIIAETALEGADLLNELEQLAEVCDADTRVIIIGLRNDVDLYRRLVRFGVSEYVVAPIDPMEIIRTIGEMFVAPDADPLGRVIAFCPARGGCGSSTIAQNVAWSIATLFQNEVIIGDFDLAGGTVGLNYNQDPQQGIMEALLSPNKLDETYFDRLVTKCTQHLSLLAAPASVERTYDLKSDAVDQLIEIAQKSVPYFVADLPNQWSEWTLRVLSNADQVVITATPDLVGLRNAKNIYDRLKQDRVTDTAPRLVLNKVGRSKDTEIKAAQFEDALDAEIDVIVPFEPSFFGTAMNNGQMLGETNPKSPIVHQLKSLATTLTGRADMSNLEKKSSLMPLLSKLRGKKAS